MRELFVVVSGAPGAGKSTLALPLARALDLPLIAKDTVKEALGDEFVVQSLAESQRLGRATMRVLIALAATNVGAVLESTWHSALAIPDLQRLRSPIVEVNCNVPPEIAQQRYVARAGTRHAVHFDVEHGGDAQGWIDRHPQCIKGPWPLLTVDTTKPVDIAALVEQILAA